MVDTIIVYMIRGTRKVEPVVEEEKKSKLFYKTYSGTDKAPTPSPLAENIANIETSAGRDTKIITPAGYHYLDHPE
jgi:hypothetical protein